MGRRNAVANPAADISYGPIGQLLTETQTLAGSKANMLAHSYDVLGNRIQTALPDQRTLNWLFYGSGHLHQINLEEHGQHHIIADIERDALHREVTRSQGQLLSRYDYDPMGRLTRHKATGIKQAREATAGIERAYQYDAAGNLTARLDSLRETTRYKYDPTGRILAAEGAVKEAFAFDPAGNIAPVNKDRGPSPVKGNRLTVYQDVRFEYDLHGNVTQRRKGAHEEANFKWNADHQLVKATVTRHGVTQSTRYDYDALGRRTRKSDAFGSTAYLWDGDLLIESRRGSKTSLYIFEPASFVPLATIQDQATYWYQCDQIGTPQELTDAEGNIVWAAEYKVWGEATLRKTGTDGGVGWQSEQQSLPNIEQPFRFQGQQHDEETGLHYNRFRYYDPVVGRFVSQDPIGLVGGTNLFEYAPNPVRWIDPFGLAKSKITCPICGVGCYGRSNKQKRLKELAEDPKQPASIRGWIKNELRHIETGNRTTIRMPGNSRKSKTPGKELAHGRGTEAKDGYCYLHSDMQDADLHKLQHKHEGY